MTTSSICKRISPPKRVAHALNWQKGWGRILNLAIKHDRIDLAIATHPYRDEAVREFSPMHLNIKLLRDTNTRSAIAKNIIAIAEKHRVCGTVVHWPLEEQGHFGAPCGRVLNALEQIESVSNGKFFDYCGPICLWSTTTPTDSAKKDEWARDPVFGRPPPEDLTVHRASVKQYKGVDVSPSDIWDSFCREHWPEYGIDPDYIDEVRLEGQGYARKANLIRRGSWLSFG